MMNSEACRLPGLFLINVQQQLSTTALNSISTNICLPYWKSQGILFALDSGQPVEQTLMKFSFSWAKEQMVRF